MSPFYHKILVWLAIINVMSFFIMGTDKRKAIKGGWRVSEKTLFLLAILGGSVGCGVGMIVFRHKIRNVAFIIGIPLIMLLQIILLVLVR